MVSSHDAPPDALDGPLELDPADWAKQQVYFLLTGLVVPRPIAWVSTVSAQGVRNLAPYSFFNVASIEPPHVVFASGGVKDTLRNIHETGEFVVNLAALDVVEELNATATDLPADHDEFAWVGLEAAPSVTVQAPRVARAKAHLECRFAHELPLGSHTLVVGEVTHIHVDPEVWSHGRVDPGRLDPASKLAGGVYAGLGDVFNLARPAFADVEAADADARIPRRT